MVKAYSCGSSFAAVCVTCYQADKSPVETTSVSNNNVMSTDEIKELISQGTAGKDLIQKTLLKPMEHQFQNIKKTKKQVRLKQEQRKFIYRFLCKWRYSRGWCRKHSHTNYRSSCWWICRRYLYRLRNRFRRNDHCSGNCH